MRYLDPSYPDTAFPVRRTQCFGVPASTAECRKTRAHKAIPVLAWVTPYRRMPTSWSAICRQTAWAVSQYAQPRRDLPTPSRGPENEARSRVDGAPALAIGR